MYSHRKRPTGGSFTTAKLAMSRRRIQAPHKVPIVAPHRGKPHLWSDQRFQDVSSLLNYDLAPDGKRFAILAQLKSPTDPKGAVVMTFLVNFFDERRRRVPIAK